MKITKYILSLAVLIAALGCQRRPLEYFYKPEAKIVLEVDWSDFPEKPTGMTVFLFKQGEAGQAFTTSEVDRTELNVSAGTYKLFVMNQSVTEIGGVTFRNMGTYETAEAVISKVASKWYSIVKGVIASTEGEDLIGVGIQPDDLGIAIADEFTISEDEVKNFQYQYAKWRKGKGKQDGDGEAADDAPIDKDAPALRTIKAAAHNVVSHLHVKIYFKNIQNLASVRTSMEGLAESFFLTQGTTSRAEVAQLVEEWKMVKTAEKEGYVESTISTFALPNGETSSAQRNPEANIFTVQALHADHQTITTEVFPVGDKFRITVRPKFYRLHMELEVGPIILPNYDPSGDAGGFITNVVDWDDLIDVTIPI